MKSVDTLGRVRPGSFAGLVVVEAAVLTAIAATTGTRGLFVVLGIAIALPLSLALCQRPQQGVLVLVALVPFDGLRLIAHLPAFANSWKEGVVLATLAATFVAPAEARAPTGNRRLPRWAPAVIGLLVLGLASAAAVKGSQAVTGYRIEFFYLLLGAAVWRCPLGRREQDSLVTLLMATGVLTSIWGIGQQVLGQARLHSMGYAYNSVITTTGGHLRSFSTFVSPFAFSYFLMVVLLLGLPSALGEPRRPRNLIFLACLPLFVIALLFTFTRGAWLGLAAGGLYLGVRRHRILLLAVPVVLLAFAFLPGTITSSSFSSTSLGQRSTGWQQNFHQVLEHPFGSGIGSTGAAAAKVAAGHGAGPTAQGPTTYQPDNYYYKTIYELGVLGLWLWLLLLVSAGTSAAGVARSTAGSQSSLALGVTAFVLAASVASLVATFFEIFPMDVLFWLLITSVVAGAPLTENRSGGGGAAVLAKPTALRF